MTGLDQLAAAALEASDIPGGIDGLWQQAALTTIATGRPVDPLPDELMRLTTPDRVWADLPRWPPESVDGRVGRLRDTHRLAMTLGNAAWLSQLDACWSSAAPTIDERTVLRARGEISLALGGAGWEPDALETLLDEGFLVTTAPGDRAWLALAGRDLDAARRHLAELAELLTTALQRWREAPDDGIRQVRTYPGAVLRVELRALHVLAHR